jgi:hypothetical protein
MISFSIKDRINTQITAADFCGRIIENRPDPLYNNKSRAVIADCVILLYSFTMYIRRREYENRFFDTGLSGLELG